MASENRRGSEKHLLPRRLSMTMIRRVQFATQWGIALAVPAAWAMLLVSPVGCNRGTTEDVPVTSAEPVVTNVPSVPSPPPEVASATPDTVVDVAAPPPVLAAD